MRLALAGDELGAAQVDHLGGDGDGDLLGAERLDVRRGNLGGRVGVGDLTPLLHQRKPGAAHNGVARFLAMALGTSPSSALAINGSKSMTKSPIRRYAKTSATDWNNGVWVASRCR